MQLRKRFLQVACGILVLSFPAAVATAGLSKAGSSTASRWNLETSFAATMRSNPNHDGWSYRYSSTLAHRPATYRLLPQFEDPLTFRGNPALAAWQCVPGNGGCTDAQKLPFVGINKAATPIKPFTAVWPARSVDVHPQGNQFVVVAWKSPVSGSFSISGGVKDVDSVCGDGIQWFVDRGAATLASGVITNGGAQTFAAGTGGAGLHRLAVRKGQSLYFLVGPGAAADEGCDTTQLTVTIAR